MEQKEKYKKTDSIEDAQMHQVVSSRQQREQFKIQRESKEKTKRRQTRKKDPEREVERAEEYK